MQTKPQKENSPLAILTELAVEGTSSLVEAQRTLLNLAQQENDIILNGVKERIGAFLPGVCLTDTVRRSVDALIEMQQELLTNTSKQTLQWLELEKTAKGDRGAQLVNFAREGVESFARAQRKFLDVVAEEAVKATGGKAKVETAPAKATELAELAREAGTAFIEAQKRLLDVASQQLNVNLDAATRAVELVSPSRLRPLASFAGEGVKNFVDAEASLLGSFVQPRKKAAGRVKPAKSRAPRRPKAVAV